MTQLITTDKNSYAAMAKMVGIANEGAAYSDSQLPRLKMIHESIMGTKEFDGKQAKVEVVEAGSFKLEMPNGSVHYAPSIKMRMILQRFSHKRWIPGDAKTQGRYVKSMMTDDAKLESDLKDDDGGFNCGKPAGYIKDFKALPTKMQDTIKQIKRVRGIFGTVDLVNPTDDSGNVVTVDTTPFIWEVENREAFKEMGSVFASLFKMQRFPMQHYITVNSDERQIASGNKYYVPVPSLDLSVEIPTDDATQELGANFMAWIDRQNTSIMEKWKEKVDAKMSDDDVDVVNDMVQIEVDDEEAA